MLPFSKCPQIEACNPLKLREYLAAGRPVVTTEVPALEPYLDVLSPVRGHDEFVRALLCAEADTNAAARRRAVEEAHLEGRAADGRRRRWQGELRLGTPFVKHVGTSWPVFGCIGADV